MGKVEKVVVLGVLFSVLVILAVSLYSGPDNEVKVVADPSARRTDQPAATRLDRPGASSARSEGLGAAESIASGALRPGSGDSGTGAVEGRGASDLHWERRIEPTPAPIAAPAVRQPAPETTLAVADRPTRGITQPPTGGLLSSNVQRRRGADAPPVGAEQGGQAGQGAGPAQRSAPDPAWDLVTVEGLVPTLDPRFQVYTCTGDETFVSLAQALYGTEKKAALLRRDNEGVDELTAGQELLVAVVDDRPGGGDQYRVLEGENLWRIANKVYGAGHRWQEIYDANRDTLRSPDDVRVGVVLVIP